MSESIRVYLGAEYMLQLRKLAREQMSRSLRQVTPASVAAAIIRAALSKTPHPSCSESA